MVFVNNSLVDWCSKKQHTIESSVFGAGFVALKIGMETVRGVRYKLSTMGVPLTGPTYAYGDNMSVIHNTQRPESQLKKKSNYVWYHAIRESVEIGETLTGQISTDHNFADILTNVLYGQKRRRLL